MKTFSFFVLSMALCVSCASSPKSQLQHADMSRIYQKFEKKKFSDFKSFLSAVLKQESSDSALQTIGQAYLNKQTLDESALKTIYRLMGVYVRTQYLSEMQQELAKLVAIPTFKQGDLPQYQNPQIRRFGRALGALAKRYDLDFINVDNRVFVIDLPGQSQERLGIYTHGDVVPADAREWVLQDGQKLNPFELKKIGDKLYGRGTEDDKCSIIAAMTVMKFLKDNKVPHQRSIRLIVETTEETGGEGFEYYKEKQPVPEYNLVLDSGYPVIVAEKAFGSILVKFKEEADLSRKPRILSVTGGTAINQIPGSSIITIMTPQLNELKQKLDAFAGKFVQTHGGNFKIVSKLEGGRLKLEVQGVSAHSSSPESGLNPVSRAFMFLYQAEELEKIEFADNHYRKAARYVAENYGLDYYAKKLGLDYSHNFMGPLTAAVTLIETKNKQLIIGVNFRAPLGREMAVLKKQFEEKLKDYQPEVNVRTVMFRDPSGRWIKEMVEVFQEVTLRTEGPRSSSGSTTAKQLPNAVNFGPSMPGEKYMGHNANEFKKLSNFAMDAQMFTEVFLRLSNLKNMF